MQVVEPEEHVLVLEFAENSKGKKNENNPFVTFFGSRFDCVQDVI
jgi:hypothetical protein